MPDEAEDIDDFDLETSIRMARILISDTSPRRAVEWARYADCCYYQATGAGPGLSVNELLDKP